jgi:SAM-dependent methyltransferase
MDIAGARTLDGVPPTSPALEVYGQALAADGSNLGANATEPRAAPVSLRIRGGERVPLIVDRWLGDVDCVDRDALSRCRTPVLDVGCGPGRHVNELANRGVLALGVDISEAAVRLARVRGAPAIVASVFDRLPCSWRSVLLLDGNIGIGGDPVALLRRVNELLAADGEVLVELAPPQTRSRIVQVRFETIDRVSEWFDWAVLARDGIDVVAEAGGLVVVEHWERAGRYFARAARTESLGRS